MWYTILLKWIKTILNSKIFLYAVIAGVGYLWIIDRGNLRDNILRLEANQHAILLNNNEQIELTKREFKKFYAKEDSIAHLIGIKSNQIQNVIVSNYHYKDTTIVQFPLVQDSIYKSDTLKFIAPIKCMKIEGYVLDKKIVFTKEEYNDKLHTYLYGVRPHHFWFIKWGRWIVEAETYSECLEDPINIEENLKIN